MASTSNLAVSDTKGSDSKASGSCYKCSFTGCGLNLRKGPKIRFFRFPINRPHILEEWLINCGDENLISLPNKKLYSRKVCEKHFTLDCFTNDMKRFLKKDAVPTALCHNTDTVLSTRESKRLETPTPQDSLSPLSTKLWPNKASSASTMSDTIESQHNKHDRLSEEFTNSYSKDGPSASMDESVEYFGPQPAFVTVDVKEEPMEMAEENNYINSYSEELSSNSFSNEPHIKSFGNTSTLGDRLCAKTKVGTITYPFQDESLATKDACIDSQAKEHLTSEVYDVISGTDNDFTNLKNVVFKLEKISNTLALAVAADQYEQFAKYLATLLRGVPQKKFLSLKQKLISDVIEAKMSVDEANSTSPVPDDSLLKSVNPPEYRNVVNLEVNTSNLYQSTSYKNIENSSDDVAPFTQKKGPTYLRDCRKTKIPPLTPFHIPPRIYSSVWLKQNEDNRPNKSPIDKSGSQLNRPSKKLHKTVTKKVCDQPKKTTLITHLPEFHQLEDNPLRFMEDRLEIEIEEGTELLDVKPDITDIPNSNDYQNTCMADLRSQELGEETHGDEGSSKYPKDSLTSQLSCDKYNLQFKTSAGKKKQFHFTTTHTGETPKLLMKTHSAEIYSEQDPHLTDNPKFHAPESLNASPAPHVDPGDMTEKDLEYDLIVPPLQMKPLMPRLQNKLKQVNRRTILENAGEAKVEELQPEGSPSDRLEKRKTCVTCPSIKKRKTAYKCIMCLKAICLECSRKVCLDCSKDIVK